MKADTIFTSKHMTKNHSMRARLTACEEGVFPLSHCTDTEPTVCSVM